ncbi:MAG: DUF1820 family protein [Gammaproteobacteria bacterium]|nr:DUF1820 family protein [Gammaproteobacteria bacterium]
MAKTLYKIRFISGDKVYELYARHVYQGDLYGFVVIEDIVFGETTSVVVDPQEEKLKNEFEGVEKTLIPMHAVLRIDQVKKQGVAKISTATGNVASFPPPIYTPKSGD